jgi:hypothetical protein
MSRLEESFLDQSRIEGQFNTYEPVGRTDANSSNTQGERKAASDYGGVKYVYNNNENIKLYIQLKKTPDGATDYKKLIMLVPGNLLRVM